MAMRMLGRRLGLPVKTVSRPVGRQTRAYSEADYTGRPLSEKEKAAENMYIKKMEEEQKLKNAKKGLTGETPTATSPVTPSKAATPVQTADGAFRNTAIVAGLVAAVAGYWLLSGSSKKEEQESS